MLHMTVEPSLPRPAARPLWRRVFPLVLAVVLVAFALGRVDWPTFVTHVLELDYLSFFGLMGVFVVALLAADTLASVRVYRFIIGRVRFRDLLVVRGLSYLPSLLNHHVGQAWLTYFLSRRYQAPLARVAGATLVIYVTWGGCLLLLAAVALPAAGLPAQWMAAPVGLGIAYLVLLWLKPKRLLGTRLLGPLFEVGVVGHLSAMAFRIPHMVLLFLATWLPFRFFGVQIPFDVALASVPVLMVAVTVPLTPVGLGTRDALAMALFEPYVLAGQTHDARFAAIAAATTSTAVAILVINVLIGLAMMRIGWRAIDKRE